MFGGLAPAGYVWGNIQSSVVYARDMTNRFRVVGGIDRLTMGVTAWDRGCRLLIAALLGVAAAPPHGGERLDLHPHGQPLVGKRI